MPPETSDSNEDLILRELRAYQNHLDLGIEVSPEQPIIDETIPPELNASLQSMRRCLSLLHSTRLELANPLEAGQEADQSPLPLYTSSCLGTFQLLECLGMGGNGIVYRALDRTTQREVAIKIPRMETLGSEELIQRFRKEAVAAARLNHPNIVPIYETGVHGVTPYIVMPFVPGRSLASWRESQNEIPPRIAAQLVLQLAQGVAHAHERDVYHRDIKPSNVLMATAALLPNSNEVQFVPQLTDFGLAKCRELFSHHTRTGTILGTASYMAPELAAGKSGTVTAATDVYGLGTILFELLAGIPPFRKENELLTMQSVLRDDPPQLREIAPNVPPDLQMICQRCLEKQPEHRYQSASDLVKDLQRFLDGDPILARPTSISRKFHRWCQRNPIRAAFTGMTAFGICVLFSLSVNYNRHLAARAKEIEHGRQRVERLEIESRRRACIADTRLAQIAWEQGKFEQANHLLRRYLPHEEQVDVRHFAWWFLWNQITNSSRQLGVHSGGANAVAMTPAGDLAASGGADGLIHVWEIPSGDLRHTFSDFKKEPVKVLRISPDGRRLVAGVGNGSWKVWDLVTKNLVCQKITPKGVLMDLAYSPDGKCIATADEAASIQIWSAETGDLHQILKGHDPQKRIRSLAFHPLEPLLVSTSEDGTIRFWDLKTSQPDPRLPDGLLRLSGNGDWCQRLLISPKGNTLIAGTQQRRLYQWSLEAGQFGQILSESVEPSTILSMAWPTLGGPILSYTESGIRLTDSRRISRDELRLTWGREQFPAIAVDSQGRTMISSGSTGAVQLWHLSPFCELLRREERTLSSTEQRLNPQKYFWSESYSGLGLAAKKVVDGRIVSGDVECSRLCCFRSFVTGEYRTFPTIDDQMLVNLSPSGRLLIGYDNQGQVFCKDTHNFQDRWTTSVPDLKGPSGHRMNVIFSPDESAVLLTNSNLVSQYSTTDGKEIHRWTLPTAIADLLVRPQLDQGKTLLLLCYDGTLHWLDLRSGAHIRSVAVDDDQRSLSLALSQDGQLVALGNRRGDAIVRRLSDLSEIRRFFHTEDVSRIDFFDNDQYLITCGQKTHVWSIGEGDEILTFPCLDTTGWHQKDENWIWDRYVGQFSVSPDGRKIAIPTRRDILFIEAVADRKSSQ